MGSVDDGCCCFDESCVGGDCACSRTRYSYGTAVVGKMVAAVPVLLPIRLLVLCRSYSRE